MRKRELVALLSLPSLCLVFVVWLFLAVPWVCLQFMIVVFPDHTHYFSCVNQFYAEDKECCSKTQHSNILSEFKKLKYLKFLLSLKVFGNPGL